MKTRLRKWYDSLIAEGLTDYEIICGIGNGDIDRPKWLAYSPCTGLGHAIWDNEQSDGSIGLIDLNAEL